jgi:radical SAM-linked protein
MCSMPAPKNVRIRLQFAKRGDLRFLSHHDLMRLFERMMRRAAIPMAMTQGFNPRMRIVFALALGLGIESERELVDLELSSDMDLATLLDALRAESPPGLLFLNAQHVVPAHPARLVSAGYGLDLPESRLATARQALDSFHAKDSCLITRRRDDRSRSIDLRASVIEAELRGSRLSFRLRVASEGSARPEEFLEALGLRELLDSGSILVRTGLELAPDSPSQAPRSELARLLQDNPTPTAAAVE